MGDLWGKQCDPLASLGGAPWARGKYSKECTLGVKRHQVARVPFNPIRTLYPSCYHR